MKKSAFIEKYYDASNMKDTSCNNVILHKKKHGENYELV